MNISDTPGLVGRLAWEGSFWGAALSHHLRVTHGAEAGETPAE